jgi:hypothetical protein
LSGKEQRSGNREKIMGFAQSDGARPLVHELLMETDASLQVAIQRCLEVDLSERESMVIPTMKMLARLELAGEIIREARLTALALEVKEL